MTASIDTRIRSARPKRRAGARPWACLIALGSLAATLVLAAAPACAQTTRVEQAAFGGSLGTQLDGTAVDQSTGDVYVADALKHVVLRFDSSGAPDNFTAGPDAGTNVLTGFEKSPVIGPSGVAVDNSGGPLDGDFYVIDGGKMGNENSSVIKVFARSGAPLGEITEAGASPSGPELEEEPNLPFNRLYNPCGIAVDQSDGSVYVGEGVGVFGPAHIWRYTPSSPSGAIDRNDYVLTGVAAGRPFGLAADAGHVYAVEESVLRGYQASAFTASYPAVTGAEVASNAFGVATDPGNGDVYVDEAFRVAVFDKTGTFLYRFGRPGEIGTKSAALAVKAAGPGAATKVYVAGEEGDEGSRKGQVYAYGPVTQVQHPTLPEQGAFGPDGTSTSAFSSIISPLAFQEAARSLYIASYNPLGIFGFDASAPPSFALLAGFEPLSLPASLPSGLAVDNSGGASHGHVYAASRETGLVYGFDASGNALGGNFPIDPEASPGAPYGSPKAICGVAVDSAGHIWVANRETKRILEYSSDGASLGVTIDASSAGSPCNLAFDAAGNLYVVNNAGALWRFAAAGGYTASVQIVSADVQGVAIDRAGGHVFVVRAHYLPLGGSHWVGWVEEYDESGQFLGEFIDEANAFLRGAAVDETNHDLYVADEDRKQVRVFGPPAILPEVSAAPASAVANDSATLNGTVAPQQVALTGCHFEYVTEEAFRVSKFSDLSSGGSVPCSQSPGSIPADFEAHAVSANVSGLAVYTTYRFRLVAANAQGSAVSTPESFATASPPGVEIAGAPDRSATTAVLNGRVNPRNGATTFHFEYGEEGPCSEDPCQSTPGLSAGSGNEIELVASQLEGLQPDTTYHYRLVADNGNSAGAAVSGEMTVTTRGSDSLLSHGHFPGPPGSDRAYEQVSLPDSGGNPVGTAEGFSEDGNYALYSINGGTPITDNGSVSDYLLAERTSEGWHSRQITPPRPLTIAPDWQFMPSSDFKTILAANYPFSEKVESMVVWQLSTSGESRELLHTSPPETQAKGTVLGVSKDGRREIAFVKGPVDPEYPGTGSAGNLYDVGSGSPRLVSVLPGNVPACINGEDKPSQATVDWISPDGSRVYFPSVGTASSCTGPTELYMREVQAGQTRLLSGPVLSGEDCGATLIRATEAAVFFWSQSRLAPNDTAARKCGEESPVGGDVYRYDVNDQSLKCLTCVVPGVPADVYASRTPSPSVKVPADVAVAPDGSRVYFKTKAHLLAGAQPEGEFGAYRVDVASGDLAYVAPIGESHVGQTSGGSNALSGDGSVLVFRSESPKLNPIGGPGGNGGKAQYYRYDDRDRSLVCISCMPDGSSREGVPVPLTQSDGGARLSLGGASEDGSTIVFVTANPLVAADQNTPRPGENPASGQDVYEWRDGRLSLITDGLTRWPANGTDFETPRLGGVSPSGRDVYFTAPVQYTPDALDGYRRLYDARIGGGIEFPQPPVPCSLEVCQGTPNGAPFEQAPGTVAFTGPGNVEPAVTTHVTVKCSKRQRRVVKGKKARCLAKRVKKKHNKKSGRKRRAKAGKSNRNGGSAR